MIQADDDTIIIGAADAARARLEALIRLPSVSTDPAYEPGMRRARDYLLGWFREMGLQDVQLLDGGGHPAVYGAWLGAPGRPTLLIYGHYDVQPPDPVDAWLSPPFEPTERDGCLFGRGASDDKGSSIIAIAAVAGRRLPATDRRVPGQRQAVPRRARRRSAARRYPPSLHEMARPVASLHRPDGTIAVAGYLDAVPPPTEQARRDAAVFAVDETAFCAEVAAVPLGEPGYTLRERLTLRPTVEVNGMWGGYTGVGAKTVIPHVAHAKLTMRLVAGQNPRAAQALVCAHLEAQCPPGMTLEIERRGGSPASSLAADHPLVRAGSAVLERLMGAPPVPVRLAATVPITAEFKLLLGIDTLMFAFGLPDEDVHAPNEFYRLSSIPLGLRAWVMLLDELSRVDPAAFTIPEPL